MKPVVSSLVALAIAIAAPVAMATPDKPAPAKHAVHKAHKKIEKADKADKIVAVKHVMKKDKADKKHVEGHKGEPKVDQGVTVIPASLTTKPKLTNAKLPAPSAKATQGKSAHEKGARKPSKKSDSEGKDGGQPERDEDFAELVARIRGKHAKCAKEPVELARGSETETFELTTCDGVVAPLAVEKLSVMIRPGGADRPIATYEELAKKKGAEIAKGIRRVDPGLVSRLAKIIDHFGKHGGAKIDIVSGYRPTSTGSLHATGRAIDFRFEGAKNEDIVAFCKTLNDTGCGFYPNSSFVHVDVRDLGAGHISWIDASGPGETPRYVTQWPEPIASNAAPSKPDGVENASAKQLDREMAPEPPIDEHPAAPTETLEPLEKP